MKKLFLVLIALALVFTACPPPTDDGEDLAKLPNLTIKNESSFDLTDVKFAGISFTAADSTDLPKTTQAVKQLTENAVNEMGYITFIRKDIGIVCRVSQALAIEDADYTFTFLDSTVVEEIANTGNKKPLSAISFVSKLAVERGGINIPRNDTVNFGEATITTTKQIEFTLKNTGVGKLLFDGSEPVKITSADANVFSVIQPASSEIAPDGSLPFKINFNPSEQKSYSGTVTVKSNDGDGDFVFTINATGVPPKPIASVFYGETEIAQNGTIDAGEVLITQSTNITVEIRNTGTQTLTIDTANITITGADSSAFTKTTTPGSSVSAGNKTSFVINCAPVNVGENNAILTIPTNDESRNPVIIYLKTSGVKGTAVLELSQGDTAIQNNSLMPFDFGVVNLGESPKNITFTIKNTGNIALELTGSPTVKSSSPKFTISTPPSTKTLAPGASVPFIARYTPTAEQEDTGTITIMNNGSAMDFSFPVKGNGYEKKSQVTVTHGGSAINQNGEFDFGNVATDVSKDITFTIGNTGDAILTFEVVDGNRINLVENPSGYFAIIQPISNMVAPGSTANFTVQYKPTAVGKDFTAAIEIKTNSYNNAVFHFTVRGNSFQQKDYQIGDTGPAGGLVFYDRGSYIEGWRYMEAVPTENELSVQWGLNQYNNNGTSDLGTRLEIGTGAANTKIVVNFLKITGETGMAAQICDAFVFGEYDDWFLPSKDELAQMYKNLNVKGLGNFKSGIYWTSSGGRGDSAWVQDFRNGEQHVGDYYGWKWASYYVRAIRAF